MTKRSTKRDTKDSYGMTKRGTKRDTKDSYGMTKRGTKREYKGRSTDELPRANPNDCSDKNGVITQ